MRSTSSIDSRINLTTFRIFRDLVHTRSFSRTAELHSMTQSAVSQQIAGLEKRLSCALIERGGKDLNLTLEGQRFYQGCHEVTTMVDKLIADLKEITQQIHGELKVVTVYSIGLHDLPPYLKKFIKEFPSVEVRVDYRRSADVYTEVKQGKADIGFVAFPEKKGGLIVKPFKKDRMVLICHPNHRLATSKSIPIEQITDYEFVGFDPDPQTRKALNAVLKKHKIKVKQVMDFDNVETLKRAVEIDMGVSLVPLSTVSQEVKNRTLRVVDFSNEEIFRPLGVVFTKSKESSAALRAFLELIQMEFV
jgi:LysR family transcriptional regulator, transcriptional activator of the cysJI operon